MIALVSVPLLWLVLKRFTALDALWSSKIRARVDTTFA